MNCGENKLWLFLIIFPHCDYQYQSSHQAKQTPSVGSYAVLVAISHLLHNDPHLRDNHDAPSKKYRYILSPTLNYEEQKLAVTICVQRHLSKASGAEHMSAPFFLTKPFFYQNYLKVKIGQIHF